MDGILSDGRKGELWFCQKYDGHVLGITVKDNNSVKRLLLFHEAVKYTPQEQKTLFIFHDTTKVRGTVEGTMYDIECTCCKAKRTWWMDRSLVASLLAPLYQKA
jgi:hypothetical protein